MTSVHVSIRSNIEELTKSLSNLAYKQVPYATALALTALAKQVQEAEQEQIKATFKHPKPFTVKSVGMRGATKASQQAIVFVRPIAAKYLAPYEGGGDHVLPGRALLNPKDIRLDKYGQLTRATMARLKARPDIFIGPIKTEHGSINGVWQRIKPMRGKPGQLKLLIRFGDALPVNKSLGYGTRAKSVVDRGFNAAFGAAIDKAMASAR